MYEYRCIVNSTATDLKASVQHIFQNISHQRFALFLFLKCYDSFSFVG